MSQGHAGLPGIMSGMGMGMTLPGMGMTPPGMGMTPPGMGMGLGMMPGMSLGMTPPGMGMGLGMSMIPGMNMGMAFGFGGLGALGLMDFLGSGEDLIEDIG